MRYLFREIVVLIMLGIVVMAVAIASIALPFPSCPPETGVFGFYAEKDKNTLDVPALQQLRARDGDALACGFDDSASERLLIFIDGSSCHGGGYDELAPYVSARGAAKVVLPIMRRHYFSARRRGALNTAANTRTTSST